MYNMLNKIRIFVKVCEICWRPNAKCKRNWPCHLRIPLYYNPLEHTLNCLMTYILCSSMWNNNLCDCNTNEETRGVVWYSFGIVSNSIDLV